MNQIEIDKPKLDDSEKLDLLYQWAVWAHLSSKKDTELILLKGHLLLETALGTTLSRNGVSKSDNYSFYRKIILLEKNATKNSTNQFIFDSLKGINLMRNKLAHEFIYEELDNDLESWSKNILENLKGEKFCKFTFRTKIIHSFSILTFNLLKVKNYR